MFILFCFANIECEYIAAIVLLSLIKKIKVYDVYGEVPVNIFHFIRLAWRYEKYAKSGNRKDF